MSRRLRLCTSLPPTPIMQPVSSWKVWYLCVVSSPSPLCTLRYFELWCHCVCVTCVWMMVAGGQLLCCHNYQTNEERIIQGPASYLLGPQEGVKVPPFQYCSNQFFFLHLHRVFPFVCIPTCLYSCLHVFLFVCIHSYFDVFLPVCIRICMYSNAFVFLFSGIPTRVHSYMFVLCACLGNEGSVSPHVSSPGPELVCWETQGQGSDSSRQALRWAGFHIGYLQRIRSCFSLLAAPAVVPSLAHYHNGIRMLHVVCDATKHSTRVSYCHGMGSGANSLKFVTVLLLKFLCRYPPRTMPAYKCI